MAELLSCFFLITFGLMSRQSIFVLLLNIAFGDVAHLDAGFYLTVLVHYWQDGLHAAMFHQV